MIINPIADAENLHEDLKVSIPEQYLKNEYKYDPADDVLGATDCLVCGEHVPLRRYERGPKVCNACRDAILAIRQNNRRVACGEIIPEGRQVCPKCERDA